MNKALNFQKNLIIFGIPVLILSFIVLIATSSNFKANPEHLATGITFDLLITVPFIYFLLIRKTKIPKTTVVPLIILGVVLCSLILPLENQQHLNLFKTWVLPVIEILVVSYVLYNVRKGIRSYNRTKGPSIDFFTTLKNTCYELLPKGVVIPVVTEIAVFYYGFVYWKKRELKENEFSYHKDSGTIPLLLVIIFLVGIETVVLHILLTKWSSFAAWSLTVLSIYSAIQLFGFLKSMLKRPIAIENDKLYLRYGIMNETIIDVKTIDHIEISSKDLELNDETRKLSFLGALENHNLIIHLKEKNHLTGLYGIRRTYKHLAVHIDRNLEFKNQLYTILQQEK